MANYLEEEPGHQGQGERPNYKVPTRTTQLTCITETSDIVDPVSDGGFDNLDFGLAE